MVIVFVEILSYKLQGRKFDSRLGHFNSPNPSNHTTALGSTRPLKQK
jgi:hypothetical protein